MACVDCRWFERQGDEPELDKGSCRRRPPTACYDAEADEVATCWPMVDWMDWCGEFERRAPERRGIEEWR